MSVLPSSKKKLEILCDIEIDPPNKNAPMAILPKVSKRYL
jgi:hypothetical protein